MRSSPKSQSGTAQTVIITSELEVSTPIILPLIRVVVISCSFILEPLIKVPEEVEWNGNSHRVTASSLEKICQMGNR